MSNTASNTSVLAISLSVYDYKWHLFVSWSKGDTSGDMKRHKSHKEAQAVSTVDQWSVCCINLALSHPRCQCPLWMLLSEATAHYTCPETVRICSYRAVQKQTHMQEKTIPFLSP